MPVIDKGVPMNMIHEFQGIKLPFIKNISITENKSTVIVLKFLYNGCPIKNENNLKIEQKSQFEEIIL